MLEYSYIQAQINIDLDFVEKIFQNAVIYVCIINPCKEVTRNAGDFQLG